MQTTYLLGVFVPNGTQDGDKVGFRHLIPIKITELQKEALVSSPDKQSLFVREAFQALCEADPELVKNYERTHFFIVIDPEKRLGMELEPYVKELQKGDTPEDALDLTEEKIKIN